MKTYRHCLTDIAFERLQEQVATAAALCSDAQVLELADGLHDALRRRRQRGAEHRLPLPPRSFDLAWGSA